MSQASSARTASFSLAVALLVVGCGDSNPSALPFADYAMAGIYTPTDPSTGRNMRLALGTRHTLTGSYENSVGDQVRFYGRWELHGDEGLTLFLDGAAGLPGEVALQASRERIVTEIPSPPTAPDMGPSGPPQFDYTDVRRLQGTVVIEGTVVQLDLFSEIHLIDGAGGGQTAN